MDRHPGFMPGSTLPRTMRQPFLSIPRRTVDPGTGPG